jgi:nitrogen fixation-related uncharacterized protein
LGSAAAYAAGSQAARQAHLWSLKSGQYEDLDGAAERILFEDELVRTPRRGR